MPFKPLPRPETAQPTDQNIRFIPLTQGKHTIVDAADYEWLSQWNWHATSKRSGFYVARNRTVNKKTRLVYMHRVILGLSADDEYVIDHIDGNGLNNTRKNLRIATTSDNLCNRSAPRTNTSGFKGVSWYKGKWQVAVTKNKKSTFVGVFATKEEAYKAYCEAAKRIHGEFANVG